MTTHFLAGPWGLPGVLDDVLADHLEAEAWDAAVTLLRDQLPGRSEDPRLLLLLAHARFRDATDVMFDELLPASQEALKLIDAAVEKGIPLDAVAPFRDEVERVLAEQTQEELKLLAAIPEDGNHDAMPLRLLLDAAYLLWDRQPAQAARMFETAARKLAEKQGKDVTERGPWFNERLRSALCDFEAGDVERASPVLEEATRFDWAAAGIWQDRRTTETAFARLLERCARARDLPGFETLWTQAQEKSRQLGYVFPSIHKDQERLLDLCLQLGDGVHASALATQIEGSRKQSSRRLLDKLRRAKALGTREAVLPERRS